MAYEGHLPPLAAPAATAGRPLQLSSNEVQESARERESTAKNSCENNDQIEIVSTTASSSLHGPSEASLQSLDTAGRGIVWDELTLGRSIEPFQRYAHCSQDIYLLSCLLRLIAVPDVCGDVVKLMLRALRFLHLCDYSADDICSILAHASAYFNDVYVLCGNHMDRMEVGSIIVTEMFIAHAYVQDETCPLNVWHKHLFRKYCTLGKLSAAVLRLMELRGYVLRLDSDELESRFAQLRQAAQPFWADQSIGFVSSSSGQPSEDASGAVKLAENAATVAASEAAAAERTTLKAKGGRLWEGCWTRG